MSEQTPQKKPLEGGDWHRADIKAALEKAGWTLRKLDQHHGLPLGSLRHVFRFPWHRCEVMVAEALGLHPMQIWPSRYHADGTPYRKKGGRPRKSIKEAA
ncbi:MAG: helix-turn-helix domain-containing protein [Magnetococcales bacterium]|nr:helix-turn-helix domain-containing protein [Magnetococcales bacterium]